MRVTDGSAARSSVLCRTPAAAERWWFFPSLRRIGCSRKRLRGKISFAHCSCRPKKIEPRLGRIIRLAARPTTVKPHAHYEYFLSCLRWLPPSHRGHQWGINNANVLVGPQKERFRKECAPAFRCKDRWALAGWSQWRELRPAAWQKWRPLGWRRSCCDSRMGALGIGRDY
jgi:hypothetical protein